MINIKCCGDKSISHRSIILGSLANGVTTVENLLEGDDCLRTIQIFKDLGIKINKNKNLYEIYGKGLYGLQKPISSLYCGNSGTSIRLISGILAAQPFTSTIYGDISIAKRPMDRIIIPLQKMNAKIISNNSYAPISFLPSTLNGIYYDTKAASAQVKSCILLASLYCKETTIIKEKFLSRSHTENMLSAFGADIISKNTYIKINPINNLTATHISIPNDISAAAFFMVAATITPNASIIIKNVNINPTRCGIVNVLKKVGASINIINIKNSFEPTADIVVNYNNSLKPIRIFENEIPSMIDEIPIISLLLTQINGVSIINGINELKYKESNRIESIYNNLTKIGCKIKINNNSMYIYGKTKIKTCNCSSYNDHRIAMMLKIADFIANDKIILDNEECIKISYPNFFDDYDIFYKNFIK